MYIKKKNPKTTIKKKQMEYPSFSSFIIDVRLIGHTLTLDDMNFNKILREIHVHTC